MCNKVDLPSENINFDVPFLKHEKCDTALSLTLNFISGKKKKEKRKEQLSIANVEKRDIICKYDRNTGIALC